MVIDWIDCLYVCVGGGGGGRELSSCWILWKIHRKSLRMKRNGQCNDRILINRTFDFHVLQMIVY